jgi:hypothetical protein
MICSAAQQAAAPQQLHAGRGAPGGGGAGEHNNYGTHLLLPARGVSACIACEGTF